MPGTEYKNAHQSMSNLDPVDHRRHWHDDAEQSAHMSRTISRLTHQLCNDLCHLPTHMQGCSLLQKQQCKSNWLDLKVSDKAALSFFMGKLAEARNSTTNIDMEQGDLCPWMRHAPCFLNFPHEKTSKSPRSMSSDPANCSCTGAFPRSQNACALHNCSPVFRPVWQSLPPKGASCWHRAAHPHLQRSPTGMSEGYYLNYFSN